MGGKAIVYQINIKNGTVIDPANNLHGTADVVVANGRIAGVGDYQKEDAANVIDAKGCYVVPGLIDHHMHIYPLATNMGLPGEGFCFGSGITTAVDAGSIGTATYDDMRAFLAVTRLRIRPYLHVSPKGLSTLPQVLEDVDPIHYDEAAITELIKEHPGEFVGLKIRTSKEIVKEFGYRPVMATLELAEKLGQTIMVHCTNPPGPLETLLDMLRPGDVLTHMYMGRGSTLIGENGHVIEAAWRARERGVIFEAADGKAHFSYPVCEAALRDGFYPDIIATDQTRDNMYARPTTFSLAMQLARYTQLGLSLDQVIACVTANPAKQLGMLGEIGCLSEGAYGDITVLRPIEKKMEFGDRAYGPECNLRYGDIVYQPVLTVKDGFMVYRDVTF